MDKIILTKRLSIIKFLFRNGLEQSLQAEIISFYAVLTFHDSVEMFLKLAAEYYNVKADNFNFLDYWDKLPHPLTLKESMKKLNLIRVALKHKGVIPAKVEIEAARIIVSDFFEQNTPTLFGINFDQISLFDLVSYEGVKKILISSDTALANGNTTTCVELATTAFHELLLTYKESKRSWWGYTHLDFGEPIGGDYSIAHSINDDLPIIAPAIEEINRKFELIYSSIEILALGLDYKKFIKFRVLAPTATKIEGSDKYIFEITGNRIWNKKNCQFLIDFVLDSALKLQEFDFDFAELDDTDLSLPF